MAKDRELEGSDHGEKPKSGGGEEKDDGQEPAPAKQPLETVMAGISAALIVTVAGLLVWSEMQSTKPPVLEAQQGETRREGNRYYLTVRLDNKGDEPAREVEVEGTQLWGSEEMELGTVTFDWVPGRSHRLATIIMEQNPEQVQVELRVTGYANP